MINISFDKFIWFDEGLNTLDDEVKDELIILISEVSGWLEFARKKGSVIVDIEYDANNPILQMIIKSHIVESVMEYNLNVPDDRKISISQKDIEFRQEENEIDVDMTFYLLKNLQRVNISIPLK